MLSILTSALPSKDLTSIIFLVFFFLKKAKRDIFTFSWRGGGDLAKKVKVLPLRVRNGSKIARYNYWMKFDPPCTYCIKDVLNLLEAIQNHDDRAPIFEV